jgi:hypothetical protein
VSAEHAGRSFVTKDDRSGSKVPSIGSALEDERAHYDGSAVRPKKYTAMTLEIPATGERLEARLVEDRFQPLALAIGKTRRVSYVLENVLSIGWRIVECTPGERAIVESHGITVK